MVDTRHQTIFFDAGNTLFAETIPRHKIYCMAAQSRGLDVTPDRMRDLMAHAFSTLPVRIDGCYRFTEGWFRTFIEEIFGRLGFRGNWQELFDELFSTFRDPETFRLFPETRGVLKRLKGAGIRLAVISNWSPPLPALLTRLGIGGDFDVILVSAVAGLEKPDPAIFHKAMELMDSVPEECLHVGDHLENDIEGAQGVGIRALLLDRGEHHPDFPDRLKSLDDLPPFLGMRGG